jgi:hypothetical protein
MLRGLLPDFMHFLMTSPSIEIHFTRFISHKTIDYVDFYRPHEVSLKKLASVS